MKITIQLFGKPHGSRLTSFLRAHGDGVNLLGRLLSAALGIAVALALGAVPAGAQQGANLASISGKVTVPSGQGTSDNLSGIVVSLSGPTAASPAQSAITDADGRYVFSNLAAGAYKLDASQQGFKPWTMNITLVAGQMAVADVVLEIVTVSEQVEVHEEATTMSTQSSTPTATVSDKQLEDLPLPTARFTEALSLSPGVIRTGQGKLNFNGQSESQGMLLVDSTENVDPVSGSFAIPIPVEAIQTMTVYNAPDSAEFGGFSGGLTRIELKPPASAWNFKVMDFFPSFRGKHDHLEGIENWVPRVHFGGPVLKDRVYFAEDIAYEFRRRPVRGLPWPHNETVTRTQTSLTTLQTTISDRHVLNFNINIFPSGTEFANASPLIPQTASASYFRKGVSVGISDNYQFVSGSLLSTVVRYTRFDSTAYGQGPADMLINPEGWGGNFFNAWSRGANQLQAVPTYQLPMKTWHGAHEVRFGADLLYRSYDGSSLSHPIQVLAENGSVAETIRFQGAGHLNASDVEISEFLEDHWAVASRLSLNYGARLTSQTTGRDAGFAPRVGGVYTSGDGKTAVRSSIGVIYGHVSLLADDYNDNQQRVVTFFNPNGTPAGPSTTYQNVFLLRDANGASTSVPRDSGTSARTISWSAQVERQIHRDVNLRVGYIASRSDDLFLVNPLPGSSPGTAELALQNTGVSRYQQAELNVHYKPSDRADVNGSYVWSRARGDLNTLADTFVSYQTPVIRPNFYGVLPSDVTHRVLVWGTVHLPWRMAITPVGDVHSGLPYSHIDVLQNYVGAPNSVRFPEFFSLDLRVYREITMHLPFRDRSKKNVFRIGFYSLNVTNHHNYSDVYNNVTSPIFDHFTGFQYRQDGMIIDFVR